MSLLTVGVLLDDAGHVLVGDMHIEDKYIDRIEVVAPNGTRYPAVREKILDRAPAVLLKITQELRDWKAPAFAEQTRIEEPGSVYFVGLSQVGYGARRLALSSQASASPASHSSSRAARTAARSRYRVRVKAEVQSRLRSKPVS